MEEKDMFQRGFNDGYQMARFEPDLLKQILKSKGSNDNEYLEGLDNGKRQHEKELIQQQIREAQQSRDRGRTQ